jgi:hypothetical protein
MDVMPTLQTLHKQQTRLSFWTSGIETAHAPRAPLGKAARYPRICKSEKSPCDAGAAKTSSIHGESTPDIISLHLLR